MKIKSITYLIFSSLLLVTSSCLNEELDCVPFQSTNDGSWGMIKANGEILFDSEFKNEPTIPSNGMFSVQNKDGLWEIYTLEEKPQKIGGEYVAVTPFTDDVAIAVKKGEPIKIIDKQGNVVRDLGKIGSHKVICASAFTNGLSAVQTEDGYAIVDKAGNIIVQPKYMSLQVCADGNIIGFDNKYENSKILDIKLSVLDNTGKQLSTIPLDKYFNFSNKGFVGGKMAVKANSDEQDMWGFVDTKGEVVVKPTEKNKNITDYTEEYYIYYDGESYGLKDFNGETIIRAKYDELSFANEDGSLLWAASKTNSEQRWTLINTNDEKISKEDYKTVSLFKGDHAFVKSSDKYFSIIDNEGKEIKLTTDIFAISTNQGAQVVYSDINPPVEEQIDSEDIEDENFELDEDISGSRSEYIPYTGDVGGSAITMYLNFYNEYDVVGYYYYNKMGLNAKLMLSGTYRNGEIDLVETNKNGVSTGHFMGAIDGKCFSGTFYLPNGNSKQFSICE